MSGPGRITSTRSSKLSISAELAPRPTAISSAKAPQRAALTLRSSPPSGPSSKSPGLKGREVLTGAALQTLKERKASLEEAKRLLRERIAARNAAESSLDYMIENAEVVKQAAAVARLMGFEASNPVYLPEKHLLSFVLKAGPPEHPISSLINRLLCSGLKLGIGAYDGASVNGSFVDDQALVFVSPEHLLIGSDFRTNTLLHEIRHARHDADIASGRASPYDAVLRSPGHESILSVPAYESFFSFDELAAHRRDVAWLQRGVVNVDVANGDASSAEVLAGKKADVKIMSEAIVEIVDRAKTRLHDPRLALGRDPSRNGAIKTEIPSLAESGEVGVLEVWLPELGVGESELPARKLLLAALVTKLDRIRRFACRVAAQAA